MPLNTGTRLGAYEILSPVGAGGMGEVYRAWDATLERNGIGFTGPDAEILTSFARQYQRRGCLSPKQMIILRRRIPAYARQIVQGSDTARLEAAFSSTKTTQAAELVA